MYNQDGKTRIDEPTAPDQLSCCERAELQMVSAALDASSCAEREDALAPRSVPVIADRRSVRKRYGHQLARAKRIEQIVPPDVTLTYREAQVLHWISEGKSDWNIGQILQISAKTVNFHVENAKKKLGVATRVQAALLAERAGLLDRIRAMDLMSTTRACASDR